MLFHFLTLSGSSPLPPFFLWRFLGYTLAFMIQTLLVCKRFDVFSTIRFWNFLFSISNVEISDFQISYFEISGFQLSDFEISYFQISTFEISGFQISYTWNFKTVPPRKSSSKAKTSNIPKDRRILMRRRRKINK